MMSYYDLNQPYSIQDWNQLVAAVNNRIQYPPLSGGCDGLDPLPYVTDPHRWSVSDIQAMRSKLIETCDDISFSEPLEIWRPGIIDELEGALDQVWCDDCCTQDFKHDENGTLVQLDDFTYTIYYGCAGAPYPQPPDYPSYELEGLSVAKSGLKGRSALLRYDPEDLWGGRTGRGIAINCDGTLQWSSFSVKGSHGHTPFCAGNNWSACCASQIWIDNVLTPWLEYAETVENLQVNLEIYTKYAYCADCDE